MAPSQTPLGIRSSRVGLAGLVVLVAGYLLIGFVAGAPGSPVVPPSPTGSPIPGWWTRAASALGVDGLGRRSIVVMSLVTLLLLVASFVLVLREALGGRLRAAAIWVAAVLALATGVLSPLLLSRDVYNYAIYGRMVAVYDVNPYVEPPSAFAEDPFSPVLSREWIETRSVYGPAFTLMSAGIAGAWRDSPQATVIGFKVLAGVAMALAAWLAWVAARRWRPDRAVAAVVVTALNPVIVLHTVGGGHNDALVAAGIASALALASRRAPGSSGPTDDGGTRPPGQDALALGATACLAVATMIKVVAGLALLVWLWSLLSSSPRGRWVKIASAHVALTAAIAVAVTIPLFAGWQTVVAVANLASRQGWASGARLVARGAEAVGDGIGGQSFGDVLSAVVIIAFLAAFMYLLWLVLERLRREGLPDALGTVLVMFALASPYLLPWYAAWFVPVLVLMSARRVMWIGVTVCVVLALTGVPAEPGLDPALWRGMLLAVHYVAAPVMLVLFVVGGGSVIVRRGSATA